MILETWFILAVVSAFAAGISSFLYKIASVEKIDIVALSFYTSILTSTIVIVCVILFSDFSGFWHPMLFFAFITAATYLATSITKVKSLDYIDSAIFFPLYKVFGPALVIVGGITFFNESFTLYETIGLVASLFVPLLLITKNENGRQVNLKKGIFYVLVTAAIGGVSAMTWKYGADISPNIWMYILAGELFVLFSASLSLVKTHKQNLRKPLLIIYNPLFIKMCIVSAVVSVVAASSTVFAFTSGGSLGIVYTINSLYILIPIVLSIIFYNEHWNARKVIAIILSIVALAFFG